MFSLYLRVTAVVYFDITPPSLQPALYGDYQPNNILMYAHQMHITDMFSSTGKYHFDRNMFGEVSFY